MKALIAWFVARPCASNALISACEALALASAGHALGFIHAPIAAALIVSTFYYGREAGQLEHDLKHGTTSHGVVSPFVAFLGAEFGALWGVDNLKQWLAAAGASAAVATLLTALGL